MALRDGESGKQRKRKRPPLSLKASKRTESPEGPSREPTPPLPSLPPVFEKWRRDKDNEGDTADRVSTPPFCALNNLGNTCYVNSVLQMLRYCPGFVDCLKKLSDETVESHRDGERRSRIGNDSSSSGQLCLANKLCELYSEMEEAEVAFRNNPKCQMSPYMSTRPIDVIHAIRENNPLFTAYAQHDAQELLRCLLSYLQELCEEDKRNCDMPTELGEETDKSTAPSIEVEGAVTEASDCQVISSDKEPLSDSAMEQDASSTGFSNCYSDKSDSVVRMFQGSLVFTTKCLECESRSEQCENFLDVSVPVKRFNSTPETPSKRTAVGQNSLNWSLKQFTKPARLTGEDKYYCEVCNRHTEAEISTQFGALPPILTIHLKRFTALAGGGQSTGYVTKLSGNLATPMQLRLCRWCTSGCSNQNQTYTLFGVIMHNGCSTGSGHYLTYVRASLEAEKWLTKTGQVGEEEKPGNEPVPTYTRLDEDSKLKLKEEVDTSVDNCADSARSSSTSLSEISDMEVDTTSDASKWKWLKLDDCDVDIISHADFLRAISPSSVMTSTPYILFYHVF